MKIIHLTAENVKKISAVEIRPNGNVVQITGKNGQGKTSVLDSIYWLLAGGANVQSKPIRHGEATARIEAAIGTDGKTQLIVERRFTEKNSYLSVRTADGAEYRSPQKLLDDLLGSLAFDPLSFMRTDGRKQFEVLRGMVKLEVDIDALDTQNKEDFDARTGVNREARQKRALADSIVVADDLPEKPVDEDQLLDQMQQAGEFNRQIEVRKGQRREIENNISTYKAEAVDLRERAARLLSQALEYDEAVEDAQGNLDAMAPLPEPKDASQFRAKLDAAKTVNIAIAERTRRETVAAEATVLEMQAAELTRSIERRQEQKAKAIAEAVMPIEGLGFGDGIVIFNGVPLDQASDAEQLMVSTSIAATLNPKLRVIRIRDGSLLDDDAMVRLAAFAEERDFQIWIERVDGSGAVGFVMEDGHLRDAQAQAAE